MTEKPGMRKVTILQHRLLHYRVTLFEELRKTLAGNNIELSLVHGQASPGELARKDEGYLPWATKVNNRFLRFGGTELCWQHLPKDTGSSDLVILMQESRLVSNYPLIVKRRIHGTRLAYWGHGINFQSNAPRGLREKFKRMLLQQVDWWFAYTSATVDILQEAGYPQEQITCLNNAIDTSGFQNDMDSISQEQLKTLRTNLGIPEHSHVGLFCGSLYPDKRLDLLIAASDIIHEKIPDFHLIIVGDGNSASIISDACDSRPWAHWVGVQRGTDKAGYYKLADVILNPGLVGLHVLDAFVARLPMISTTTARHSPEKVYLEHGINGFFTSDNATDYATTTIQLLTDQALYSSVSHAAYESAQRYTLDHMVQNFAHGIEKCLALRS